MNDTVDSLYNNFMYPEGVKAMGEAVQVHDDHRYNNDFDRNDQNNQIIKKFIMIKMKMRIIKLSDDKDDNRKSSTNAMITKITMKIIVTMKLIIAKSNLSDDRRGARSNDQATRSGSYL